uniref:Uncharacterized protein n=1 Tax=Oryza barthii TaxID=65489 RepID=A0A0D3FMT5_9ORYZ
MGAAEIFGPIRSMLAW